VTADYLRTDIGHAGLDRLDERGLMPLDEARAWLAGRDAYVKGEFLPTTASFAVTEADRTWAALLSLADGAEFLTQTRRLAWIFEAVRGMENIAALQRYGDAVLDWVADNIDDDGDLTNRPWCLLPCLLACTSPAAFDVAAPINTVNGGEVRVNVVTQWILRNPDPGYRVLLDRLAAGVDDAVVALDELVGLDPRGTIASLAALIGRPAVDELLDQHEIEVEPLPGAVRAALDAAPVLDLGPASRPVSIGAMDEEFTSAQAPIFDNLNYFCAAMRLTGFVVPGGADGLVLQVLWTGLGDGSVQLNFAVYGFDNWRDMLRTRGVVLKEEGEPPTQWRLPNGFATVTIEAHPQFGAELGPMETAMLAITADRAGCDRAYLTPGQLIEHLDLPAGAQALFTLDHWQHPAACLPASDSPDLLLAVEALRERRAITSSVTGATRDDNLRARIATHGGWGQW
jgi:hypothetical protein